MKYFITALSVVALVLTLTPGALAQNTLNPRSPRAIEILSTRQNPKVDSIDKKLAEVEDKIASKAAALKKRLANFKDQQKANVVERVNLNLNKINQQRTDVMLKNLDQMSSLLTKVETKVNEKDPTATSSAELALSLSSARASIATATASVNAQKLKDYSVTISSESAAKRDVKASRDKLFTDLNNVHQSVVTARKAVATVIGEVISMVAKQQGDSDGQ